MSGLAIRWVFETRQEIISGFKPEPNPKQLQYFIVINYTSAESRIRDTDIAKDAADVTRLSILQQAGAAVLAQANQQPSIALRLLST